MQPIRHVGICGVGQMGAAAAVCFKRSGYQVLVWDHSEEQLAALKPTVSALESWLDQHIGPAPHEGGSIQPQASPSSIDEQADVVLDCIAEDMAQKVDLFKRFPRCRNRGALFITTTSGLSISEMGRRSGCGHLLAGTHFWNPPHLMPLVEVIRGQDTPDPIIDRVCELVKSIGKTPVRVNRDVPGFIGNRLLHALWREAINLVEKGIATPEDVDLVARLTFGLRMPAVGPLENMDLVGLDLIEKIHQYLLADLADNHGPSAYLTHSVRQGHLGVKSGQGFYDWWSRSAEELIQKRDIQIVHQLAFLNELEGTLR
ncbi:MAG: 3-hydroxyacyl-CoA dehydrogenase family protein [Armatimonadetes bacterium]|nr:3-hydroxyacyl-CoA dehydrogenase family protein [Armatimonadota bacterium]